MNLPEVLKTRSADTIICAKPQDIIWPHTLYHTPDRVLYYILWLQPMFSFKLPLFEYNHCRWT